MSSANPPSKSLKHVRVLVVEDHQDSADLLRHTLNRWGCDSRVCHSGAEALDEASRYQPHVTLLDLNLPDIDGYEVGRTLRKQPGLDNMALVAITGRVEEESRRRSSDAGFDLHLLKPFRPDVLHSLLQRVEQSAW
jgi:CheY-like chemotaxis protein